MLFYTKDSSVLIIDKIIVCYYVITVVEMRIYYIHLRIKNKEPSVYFR